MAAVMPEVTVRIGSLVWMALMLAGACILGCMPRAGAPIATAPGRTGGVVLTLDGFGTAPRQAQVLPAFTQANVRIDGATLAGPKGAVLNFSLGGAQVTIGNVPVGKNMVLSVEGVDAVARYATTLDVAPGATVSARIGPVTTPRADVVTALLAQDRQAGRDATHSFAARLDAVALQASLDSERARLGVIHPALFAADRIAQAIAAQADPTATASIAPPTDLSTFVRAPGRARITLAGLPQGGLATVWLDDPISPKQQNLGVGTAYISPVAPGTWTLQALGPDGYHVSANLTVPEGMDDSSNEVLLDLGRWDIKANLPRALAGTAYGTMTLGGKSKLVMAGGIDAIADFGQDLAYATSSCYAFDGLTMSTLPALPTERSYAAGAISGGNLYVFGGMTATRSAATEVYKFDGTQWSGPVATLSVGTTPHPTVGTVAGTIGSTIYLFGGNDGTFAESFDPGTLKFAAIAPMTAKRFYPASAVYGGKLYVFGGEGDGGFLSSVEAFDPGTGAWTTRAPMPVVRYGAQAIVLNDQIYVIGGMDATRRPSARVDVYDPVNDAWRVFGALNVPRGAPALGVLGGDICVLGGSDGLAFQLFDHSSSQKPLPVAALEVLRP